MTYSFFLGCFCSFLLPPKPFSNDVEICQSTENRSLGQRGLALIGSTATSVRTDM
jgi:hypothetical protein